MKPRVSHFKTVLLTAALLGSPGALAATAQPVEPWPHDNPGGTVDPNATTANSPIVGQAQPAQETDEQAAAEDEAAYQQQFQPNQIQQWIDQMMGGEKGAAGNADLTNVGGNMFPNLNAPGMAQVIGSGKMEACGNVAEHVKNAFEESIAFRNGCALAQRGDNQKIAINDYSAKSVPPMMFIFDLQGNCLGKTAVSYGNGAGRGAPQACHRNGSHLTPAGFHLTSFHDGGDKYGPHNSFGMVGLEGQGSVARGVITHVARSPGTASSWGCTGVGGEAFNAVKSTLGHGSIMYNYFENSLACPRTPGLAKQHNPSACRLDPGGNPIPRTSTAGGAPALVNPPNTTDSGTTR